MDENEELDLESLQAQIDMSMSFAQDLVSSWVESSKVATSSRSHDLEKELKEHMRRPPRLGVGASIQGTSTLFSEAARLKGQLRDKGKLKRTKEDLNHSDLDDQDESRAGVIKKKTKLDPFSGQGKKLTIITPKERANGASITQSYDTTAKTEKSNPVAVTPELPHQIIRAAVSREVLKNDKTQVDSDHDHVITSSLKTPILNLDGPPMNRDEGQIHEDGTGRKRRRKRKKKKRLKPVD